MSVLRTRFLAAAASAALLMGCAVDFQEQEVRWVVDAEGDRIELLLVTHGLGVGGVHHEEDGQRVYRPDDVERANTAVADLAAGRRRFFLFDPMLDFDIERALADVDAEMEVDPLSVRATEILGGMTVLDAGAFLDDDGRLSTWQRIRIPHAVEFVALANAALHRQLAEADVDDVAAGALERAFVERCIEQARRRDDWILLEPGRVVVHLPITRAELERSIRHTVREAADADLAGNTLGLQVLGHLAAHLEETTFTDEGCRLVFAPREGGTYAVRVGGNLRAYDPHLREVWEAEGGALEEPDLEALRAALAGG